MTTMSILALSVALAMDATAVSVAKGLAAESIRVRDVAKTAVFFGGFQAGMPLIGWLLGDALGPLVVAWTHWIGFIVLAVLGAKMLWDARSRAQHEESGVLQPDEVFGTREMFVLAVATSVDALAAGVTLPMLGAPMVLSLVAIGVVTAVLSATAVVAGRRLGQAISGPLDAVGGLVLIALAIKILAEHLGWL